MCVTNVSHAVIKEGKCMIFKTRKLFMIALINWNATTLDSSHTDSGVAGVSATITMNKDRLLCTDSGGDNRGVRAFCCTWGKRVLRSGNVTFHMHSMGARPWSWLLL
jgi:hypothetical protein